MCQGGRLHDSPPFEHIDSTALMPPTAQVHSLNPVGTANSHRADQLAAHHDRHATAKDE
jgi:hypothetical protein